MKGVGPSAFIGLSMAFPKRFRSCVTNLGIGTKPAFKEGGNQGLQMQV
jgi:hypothetical protein